jgi:predicted RNA-binding protein
VSVVMLEYEIVVVHRGNVMVVGVVRGMGGQMSEAPGGAVTTGEAEFQILGST